MAKARSVAQFKMNAKAIKAFKESTEGKNFIGIAVAMFRAHLSGLIATRWAGSQSTWAPLTDKYAAWKARKGQGTQMWKASGRTLKAITNNVPSAIGSKRGLRFGINFHTDRAFVMPQTIRKKGYSMKQRNNLFMALNWGHRKARTVRRGNATYQLSFPARPILAWEASDAPMMEKHVAEEMTRQLEQAGLPARPTR